MKPTTKQKPKKTRRFHPIDLSGVTDEDEHENPDWLVGAN